jgi:hypothetical protein
MRAFKVSLNSEELCLAGIDANGVLSAIITWAAGDRGESLFLDVGGLVSSTGERRKWANQRPIQVGDEIQVKIIETTDVDGPGEVSQSDSAKDVKVKKALVRAMAKRLGMKIQAGPKESRSRSKRRG